MESLAGHPAIAVLLPSSERELIAEELREGGFDPIVVHGIDELEGVLATRRDVVVAVIDVESDPDEGLRCWALLHDRGRNIPGLLVVDNDSLDKLDVEAPGHENDEYLMRPYTPESIRWQVEAMCIRSIAIDDGTGPVLQGAIDNVEWGHRGQMLLVFNPKGGVGKTMIATNLAAALVARGQRVLLVDADTVTGHVPTSLGMDAVPTVIDVWRDEMDGGPMLTFSEQASVHSSGLRILPLSAHPLNTELLEPQRVAGAIAVARRNFDYVIVDLHPSYSPLNRAIFDRADRILVPVTPDLPAIRAVVKLREIADELGMRDRLSLIVNRANSGIKLEDLERAIGIPTYAQVRSERPAAGQGQQRGPDADRDRAARQDHAGLRPDGGSPAGPRGGRGAAKAADERLPPGRRGPRLARLARPARPARGEPTDHVHDRRQVVDHGRRLRHRVPARLDPRPRATTQEDRPHASRGRGPDVIVQAVPHVSNLLRGQREPFGDRGEEPRIGLLDPQRLARGHQVERDVQPPEQRLGGLWLVARHADPVAGTPKALEGVDGVGIQVVRADGIGYAGAGPLALGYAEVHVRPQDPDRLAMVATTGDDGAQDPEEGQRLDAQPVGPGEPQPVLVHQGLADVEHDGADRHRQRERSCQLTPPSGAPGSFWCGAPVRLSTCSTPRR